MTFFKLNIQALILTVSLITISICCENIKEQSETKRASNRNLAFMKEKLDSIKIYENTLIKLEALMTDRVSFSKQQKTKLTNEILKDIRKLSEIRTETSKAFGKKLLFYLKYINSKNSI
jgi:hypothetical protein